MSKARHFEVASINIRVHPVHKPEEYEALWKILYSKKVHITHANNALMIGGFKADTPGFITGNFYRFLQVDAGAPWFDIEKHKKAADEDVGLVNIPPALKPNLVEIPYVLDLKKHHLYFVAHELEMNLAPYLVEKLLKRLISSPSIVKRFGDVDLTVMTDKGKVLEMLRWPVIRKLTIKLERPNPVEEDDEETVLQRLERRRLKSEIHIYQKAKGELSINVDDEIQKQAAHASDNGLVEVTGKNPTGQPDTAVSKNFPLKLKGSYTPTGLTAQTLKDALLSLVKNLT